MTVTPYNPPDKAALARSIEAEILRRDPVPLLTCASIVGAGVYAIYYNGPFAPYAPLAASPFDTPIYVGKAIPKGGRKGGLSLD